MDALVTQFKNKTLPKAQWTHSAHLAVAFWYAGHFRLREPTIQHLRADIRAFNEASGTENTDQSGYHETLTIFWVETVFAFIQNHPQKTAADLFDSFLGTPCAVADFPRQFYSSDLLFSKNARRHWVEPDLRPLSALLHCGAQWQTT